MASTSMSATGAPSGGSRPAPCGGTAARVPRARVPRTKACDDCYYDDDSYFYYYDDCCYYDGYDYEYECASKSEYEYKLVLCIGRWIPLTGVWWLLAAGCAMGAAWWWRLTPASVARAT